MFLKSAKAGQTTQMLSGSNLGQAVTVSSTPSPLELDVIASNSDFVVAGTSDINISITIGDNSNRILVVCVGIQGTVDEVINFFNCLDGKNSRRVPKVQVYNKCHF